MTKARTQAAILSISLDRTAKASLQNQLLQALRDLVHAGRLLPGARLPSSRNLAQELAVSRVTTTAVYEQLIAEGYLEGQQRLGVFVASDLPNVPIRTNLALQNVAEEPLAANAPLPVFSVGYPDLAAFPYRNWTRGHDRIWRAPKSGVLGQSHPMGYGPLRSSIAAHLREWRGIDCTARQVVVTSGLADALDVIARALLRRGDKVLVEEPGHKVLINALTHAGMACVPGPVDVNGIDLSAAEVERPRLSAVAVTPSRQYPLGITLSLVRRLELLDWAKSEDGLILEDDYDGEFRYQGQPLPAMMSLDTEERVIYIGSFSKVMFPALRLGYMVLPERIISKVENILANTGPRAALMAQPVLSEFMKDGSLATHIRRMRRLYAERQKALIGALKSHASGLLSAEAETGGMHLVAKLEPVVSAKAKDSQISEQAKDLGIRAAPLSSFFMGHPRQQGLVLGYAAFAPDRLERAVRDTVQVIQELID